MCLIFLIQKLILLIGDRSSSAPIKICVLHPVHHDVLVLSSVSLLFAVCAELSHPCCLSAAGSLPPQLPDWFQHCFVLVPLLPVVWARSQARLQPNDSECKMPSRSASVLYLELLAVTFPTGILPFGRVAPFHRPIKLLKVCRG